MRVVITDVSVFFDLHTLQILPEFFGLNWNIQTTDFVFNEILQADQVRDFDPFVRSKKLMSINSRLPMEEIKKQIEQYNE